MGVIRFELIGTKMLHRGYRADGTEVLNCGKYSFSGGLLNELCFNHDLANDRRN
jgi:hypothetical protein